MILPGIKIPWQVYACAGVVVVLGISGWKLYDLGQDHKQSEWDESIARGKVIVEQLKSKQGTVTTKIVTQTVERIKIVKEKGDTIVKRVEVLIPASTPDLPGGFRVLHDAAAANTVPDSTEGTNAEPVPVRTASSTIARNYETCHLAITELQGLRQWVQGQHQAYLDQCKASGVHCSADN